MPVVRVEVYERRHVLGGLSSLMSFITDFADQAVILPLVLAVAVSLLLQGWRRGAGAWLLAVFLTFAAMLGLKLVFLACSASLGTNALHTPSGHVAAAAVVTGGLAALVVRRSVAVLVLAGGAASVIGASRLALGMHSLPEVELGAVTGLAGAWLLLVLAGPPPRDLDLPRVALIAAAVALLFHGLHLPAEARIRSTAGRFAHILAVCQSADARL
jgi:membrane-associated phospholipid phosphatase